MERQRNKEVTFLIILVAILLIVIAFLIGQHFGKSKPEKTEPKNENSASVNDSEETAIEENKVYEYLLNGYELDIKKYSSEAEGLTKNVSVYFKIKIKKDSTDSFNTYIKSKLGEGTNSSDVSVPKVQNKITNSLRSQKVTRVYEIMRNGTNGAKTESYEIFLAKDDNDNLFVYVFSSTSYLKNNSTNNDEEKEVSNPGDYKYLIERLIFLPGDCTCSEFSMVDKIDNNSIVNTALYNLSDQQEKITINKGDSLYDELYQKYGGSSQLTAYDISSSSLTFRSIKIDKVKNKIEEIFGNNFDYTFKSFTGKEKSKYKNNKCDVVYYEYVKELNAYLLLEGTGCGGGPGSYTSKISKITKQNNLINIYVKFTTKDNTNPEYKYIFENEDNNYIIKKLEKVD